MRAYCNKCGRTVEWTFVRERTDERGRVWEVYRCRCGAEREYAVG